MTDQELLGLLMVLEAKLTVKEQEALLYLLFRKKYVKNKKNNKMS